MKTPMLGVYMIDKLPKAEVRKITNTAHDLVAGERSRRYVGQFKGGSIVAASDRKGFNFLVFLEGDDVTYFVRYHRVPKLPFNAGRQVLVIRVRPTVSNLGLAEHIFFKILMPSYGAVMTDGEQTEAGMRFWTNAVIVALRKRLFVYYVDTWADPKSDRIKQIRNDADFQAAQSLVWGTSAYRDNTFLVISKRPIEPWPE